jgi:hypothetical protein
MTMKSSLAAFAVFSLALGSAAHADDAQQPEDKKICRSEKMTGSLTRVKRICLSAREWDELRLRSKHSLEDTVRGAAGGMETKPQAGAGG